ncbi:MAG TPA: efflux RND transporter periplasmic adaptor subunit [Puia sp.]|nr:efflux RND transporter periplasmic adaptor subunit [Puia sp.]
MHKILNLTIVVISSSLLLSSCGNSAANNDTLEGKKTQLTALKDQQEKLGKQITTLEAEIVKADPTASIAEKAKLVTLTQLAPTGFIHYIDLQGNVDAENNSYISPRGGTGGVVRAVYVKQGDPVRQGQPLLKLDDVIQRQQLATDQSKLAHAQDIYQRRKNLWDEKIGAEVDLINAKNDVDQAENQVKLDQEQLGFTNVTADIGGVVDVISVKVGETFTTGGQQLHIINTGNLKVVVQVPEDYQARVKVGTPVKIGFPGLNNKEITGTVHVTGKVISASRSFQVEVRIPNETDIRANQIALIKLQDYAANKVITAPVNTLQTDEKGKYVMVGVADKGKLTAHKRSVTIGQPYADKIEIKSGLQAGDQLITDGFQGLYEGQLITTQ